MAGPKEPSPAPESALFYAPNAWASLSGAELRSLAAVGVGLPRSDLLGFVLGHEGQRENLALCNSREKILLASDLEEDLEVIFGGSTEPRESRLNNWTHSC